MAIQLSDPTTYRTIKEKLRQRGFSSSDIDTALGKRVAAEQAPGAVEAGILDPGQALEAAGGLGVPGVLRKFEGIDLTKTEKDPLAPQKKVALSAVDELERLFGRGDKENIGTKKDLSLAGVGTNIARFKGKAKQVAATTGIDPKLREDINIFKNLFESFPGIFTQAFGSGAPQEAEALRLIAKSPGPGSSDKEASAWFNSVRTLLGGIPTEPPGLKKKEVAREPMFPGVKEVEPEPIAEEPPELTGFQKVAKKTAELAPIAGGTIGGIAGGILGAPLPVVGSLAVGGAGTAVGVAAGGALAEMIEDIAGIQDESSMEQLGRVSAEAAIAGITDVALGMAFKAVSLGGNLVLKSVGKVVDDIPLKSLRINPGQITTFNKKHKVDMAKWLVDNKLLGENALELATNKAGKLQSVFDNLALSSDVKIPVGDLNKRFIDEIQKLAPGPEKIVPSQFKDIAKKVVSEWDSILKQAQSQGIKEFTPEILTNLRRATDELIPPSAFVDPSVKNIAMRLRGIYNDVVVDAVDRTLLPSGLGDETVGVLKKTGKDLSKYYDFLGIAEKQLNLGRGSLVLNLPRLLSGGFGAGVGATAGPVGAAIGAVGGLATEALLRDPAVLAQIIKAINVAKGIGPTLGKLGAGAAGVLKPAIGAAIGTSPQ